MVTIAIENIRDIDISDYSAIRIDFSHNDKGTTRIELEKKDALLLLERLQEKIV